MQNWIGALSAAPLRGMRQVGVTVGLSICTALVDLCAVCLALLMNGYPLLLHFDAALFIDLHPVVLPTALQKGSSLPTYNFYHSRRVIY